MRNDDLRLTNHDEGSGRSQQRPYPLTTDVVRCALDAYPRIKASADFDLRVLDKVLPLRAKSDSLFDRLDAIFAKPLYKLLGSTALGLVLGFLTIALMLLPQGLSSSSFLPPSGADSDSSSAPLIAADAARAPDELHALNGLPSRYAYSQSEYSRWMRALRRNELNEPIDLPGPTAPLESTSRYPHRAPARKSRKSSWDAQKFQNSDADTSALSSSSPSGSLC